MMKKVLLLAVALLLVIVVRILTHEPKVDGAPERTRIGLIVTGSKNADGWSASHYNALAELSKSMDFELLVRENVSEFDDSCIPVIDEMVAAGVRVVCLAGMSYGDKIVRVMDKHPRTYFLNAAGTEHGRNLTAFFGKMYQARYLTGLVAGMQTETNHIGYVAAMKVSEVVRGLNAFTRGVRAVNPNAVVHVRYSGLWDNIEAEKKCAEELIDRHGVDVMTYHQNSLAVAEVADRRGIYSIAYHVGNDGTLSDRCLTAAIWSWGPFYRERIEECLYSRFQSRSYWVGLEKGIIDIAPLSRLVRKGVVERVALSKTRLETGEWDVFFGPVYDNQGVLRVEEGSAMSDNDMINSFDWHVQGVEVDE